MAPQFESGFLRDDFGIRAKLGIPAPPAAFARGASDQEDLVDPADFVAWYKRAAPVLASRRYDLPMLYQIWLLRPETDSSADGLSGVSGVSKMGRAVYFEADGEQYSVFASLAPTLFARKLPAGWLREKMLPAQKQSTGFAQTAIPRVEDQLPGTKLRLPDVEGNVPISPQGFEALFLGSGVELEALPFAEVFARELRDLAAAAAHARTCHRPLHLRRI
jgi:hypothetical protein